MKKFIDPEEWEKWTSFLVLKRKKNEQVLLLTLKREKNEQVYWARREKNLKKVLFLDYYEENSVKLGQNLGFCSRCGQCFS